MRKQFTDPFIRSLKPGPKLIDFTDSHTKGLHIRVTPGGIKSFVYIFRSKLTGKVETRHIGRYPDVSYAQARAKVLGAHGTVADSKPVAFTEVKKNGSTVDEALVLYKARELTKKKSAYHIEKALDAVVIRHKWGALPVTTITRAMIKEALYHIREVRKRPMTAWTTQKRLSTFLSWCVEEEFIQANPIAGMKNVSADDVKPCTRVLTEDEIRKLWRACENPGAFGMRESYARAFQLLLLTGTRRTMVCEMTDKELFLHPGHLGPYWDVPGARMKTGKDFVTPLNDLAVAIIKRKLDDSGYVCPTTSRWGQHKGHALDARQFSQITPGVCDAIGIAKFTPHDLRRTASKLLRRAGYTRDEVGTFLAHEAEGDRVMRHYDPEDRWDGFAKKREMSDKLAAILKGIIGDRQVVSFPRAA